MGIEYKGTIDLNSKKGSNINNIILESFKERLKNKANKHAEDFVEFLNKNKLLKSPTSQFLKEHRKIYERNISITYITNSMVRLQFTDDVFNEIKTRMDNETDIYKSSDDLLLMHYITITSHLYYILFSNLRGWLDLDSLDFVKPRKKIPPTDYCIIQGLIKKGLDSKISNILDTKMRNVLAHHNWYVENRMFYGNNSKIKYTKGEIIEKLMLFTFFCFKTNNLIINRYSGMDLKEYYKIVKIVKDVNY